MTTSLHSSSQCLFATDICSDLALVADAVARVVAALADGAGNGSQDTLSTLQLPMELALTEAINNAVIHGNQTSPDKTVHVRVYHTGNIIEVQVEDESCTLQAEDLANAEMPELTASSGRGLALVKSLAPESEIREGSLWLRWPCQE